MNENLLRYISADYILTATGKPIKNGVIAVRNTGVIENIFYEQVDKNIEKFEGIIVPGFFNSHCHLEHSYKKPLEVGCLEDFIVKLKFATQNINNNELLTNISYCDNKMYNEGVIFCADICNTDKTISAKTTSKIKYHNFIETYGLNINKNNEKINLSLELQNEYKNQNLETSITPHSFYSVNSDLLNNILKHNAPNKIISIHFLESDKEYYGTVFGNYIADLLSYETEKIMSEKINQKNSIKKILEEFISLNKKFLFVHNTYINKEILQFILSCDLDAYFCLCPVSNQHIEKKLPPGFLINDIPEKIVIGTDSSASNPYMSIIKELFVIQKNYNKNLVETLPFVTSNAAKFFNQNETLGSIDTGKTPGLTLINNIDNQNLKLTKDSRAIKI